VLAASSSLLQKKSLALTANVSRELPHILADRLRFNQIVLNLVSNAVKFTEQGGVIISAQIDPADPGKMRVEVADTGIGIPQNKINAIFDRFSQADSSTTRKYGGSGLGLTICKQLVEMHGGRIGICNQPQGGSMFYFTIPLAVEGDEDDLSDFLIN
jgi:signal transduction histidine kinase